MNTYWHERDENRGERPVRRVTPPARCDELTPQFNKYLRGRYLDPDLARFNGWYPSAEAGDRLPRIVMPGVNTEGFPYWQGRAMTEARLRYTSPACPREDSVILTYPYTRRPRPVVVVEGPMDALAASGAGYLGVALMGNNPDSRVFDLIAARFTGRQVIILPDRDSEDVGGLWLSEFALRGMRSILVSISDVTTMSHPKDLCDLMPRTRANLLAEALRA